MLEGKMRIRSVTMLLLLGGMALTTACAGGAAGGPGGAISAAAANYPPGIRPRDTDATRRATVLILQEQFDEALAALQPALQTDTTNARVFLLAGQALAGQGDVDGAIRMYETAERLYPAAELDVIPLSEEAWGRLFNEGVAAYNQGDLDATIDAWDRANRIYNYRPEAFQNLAAIHTQRSEYDRAIEAYEGGLASLERDLPTREWTAEEQEERAEARAALQEPLAELLLFTERYQDAERLFRAQLERDPDNIGYQSRLAAAIASQPGREAEAQEMYTRLLGTPGLETDDYEMIGRALFTARDYNRAAEAFARVSQARPNFRDALFNQANALYASEQWEALRPVGERLLQLDPLNEDAYFMLARAQSQAGQNLDALATLERAEALPIRLSGLTLSPGDGRATVRGTVTGVSAQQGTPVQIRFTFLGEGGQTVGNQTATVNAPAPDASAAFSVEFESPTPVSGYSYELVR
jgi:tetratricopeptide (TPR) repeat protein